MCSSPEPSGPLRTLPDGGCATAETSRLRALSQQRLRRPIAQRAQSLAHVRWTASTLPLPRPCWADCAMLRFVVWNMVWCKTAVYLGTAGVRTQYSWYQRCNALACQVPTCIAAKAAQHQGSFDEVVMTLLQGLPVWPASTKSSARLEKQRGRPVYRELPCRLVWGLDGSTLVAEPTSPSPCMILPCLDEVVEEVRADNWEPPAPSRLQDECWKANRRT
ncbi:uncharacterized protein M421DRAFT_265856 [Didymella exigua CBS 183.55]|uniref:Uncharacterized protein n=1 Tax=Didymella exigua CBS 183.55 TaxID=1150837 RepID=A0A6A5RAA4_9PLEO|nr:uncharacterized protein M421DRAFT_265856 [Didymella exigua CBS 183.55]KAF1925151.1 hypothetical protein M421DRAFT_265856 [Didymella exigua CBS 183.55]